MTHIPEEIRAPARLDNLYPLLGFVTSYAKRHGAGEERIQEIELVMEELLVNIFNYAYSDKPGDVAIVCRSDDAGRFLIEIADDGIPFNILTRQEPDLDTGIEERSVGGLGIFIVRRLVQEIRYRREGGRNILTLTVDPAPAPP